MLSQHRKESDGVREGKGRVLVRRREGVKMLMEEGARVEERSPRGGDKAVDVLEVSIRGSWAGQKSRMEAKMDVGREGEEAYLHAGLLLYTFRIRHG
jgi:hypothetical protein